MLRRVWRPLAATTVVGTAGYYWYTHREKDTFEYKVRARVNGKAEMIGKEAPLLSLSAVDARLRSNETFQEHARRGIVWKHTTTTLSSNDPIEDANSFAIVTRDDNDPAGSGDLLFFSVFDGHGGFHTSQLLSKVLINGVSLALANLYAQNKDTPAPATGIYDRVKNVWKSSPLPPVQLQDGNPIHVAQVIQDAFTALDRELLNAPARLLAEHINEEAKKTNSIPDLSQHPMALTVMQPAISGACALMAMFDTVHDDLYVACTGDSRAVAGIWEEDNTGKGHWKTEVLTEDQTGRNPNELSRLKAEHPGEEETVVMRGRIMGGLEPSRAFGDARYKWPLAIQEALSQAFLAGNNIPLRPPPSSFKTPPYVTATPVVSHRKLHLPSSTNDSKTALKFVVIATDGLWDEVSSEDVVALVGGYLAGLKGKVPKSELPTLIGQTTTGTPTLDGKGRAKASKAESWVFQDENVSTHLIRNALGGGDEMALRRVVSIPPPHSRSYRDDITVTVIWWDQDGSKHDTQLRAKL